MMTLSAALGRGRAFAEYRSAGSQRGVRQPAATPGTSGSTATWSLFDRAVRKSTSFDSNKK